MVDPDEGTEVRPDLALSEGLQQAIAGEIKNPAHPSSSSQGDSSSILKKPVPADQLRIAAE